MPDALLRACSSPGCPELTTGTACRAHRRGSAHQRGYTRTWEVFRAWFIAKLIGFGIAPVCGARWPGEPSTGDSACQREGRLNNRRLHLDHTPPLADAERANERVVCDVHRVQLLCRECHNAKSARERAR